MSLKGVQESFGEFRRVQDNSAEFRIVQMSLKGVQESFGEFRAGV